jgi:hypothetical protein
MLGGHRRLTADALDAEPRRTTPGRPPSLAPPKPGRHPDSEESNHGPGPGGRMWVLPQDRLAGRSETERSQTRTFLSTTLEHQRDHDLGHAGQPRRRGLVRHPVLLRGRRRGVVRARCARARFSGRSRAVRILRLLRRGGAERTRDPEAAVQLWQQRTSSENGLRIHGDAEQRLAAVACARSPAARAPSLRTAEACRSAGEQPDVPSPPPPWMSPAAALRARLGVPAPERSTIPRTASCRTSLRMRRPVRQGASATNAGRYATDGVPTSQHVSTDRGPLRPTEIPERFHTRVS